MGSQYFARIKIGLNFEEKKQQNAFQIAENFTGKAQRYPYVENNRIGDHICYYSDLRKMKQHFPAWDITKSLEETIAEIVAAWRKRTE
jgi:CDP-paratose 2-epimerase